MNSTSEVAVLNHLPLVVLLHREEICQRDLPRHQLLSTPRYTSVEVDHLVMPSVPALPLHHLHHLALLILITTLPIHSTALANIHHGNLLGRGDIP